MSINYSTMICLLSDKVQGVSCSYDALTTSYLHTPEKLYTFKSMRTDLKRGSMVIVPTKNKAGYTVVNVWEVGVEIDIESDTLYEWIAGVFDPSEYHTTLEQERQAIEKVKHAEKMHRRKEITDRVFENVSKDELKAISFGGPTDEEVKDLDNQALSDKE